MFFFISLKVGKLYIIKRIFGVTILLNLEVTSFVTHFNQGAMQS